MDVAPARVRATRSPTLRRHRRSARPARRHRRVRARHEALRPARAEAGRPGAVNDLSLARAGRAGSASSSGRRAAARRPRSRWSTGSSSRRPAGSSSTGSTPRPATLTELRRGIGYVIQQVGLFPHQTIAENVATVPRLLGWPAARQRERAEELLGLVGLDPATLRATATRSSSRAASGSASASPGRSPPTRRSCSWTSRSGPSTRSSASASRTSSCASRRRSPRRSCSSPTTSTRRSRWATSSRSCRRAASLAQFGPPARDPGQPGLGRSSPGSSAPTAGLKRLTPAPGRRPRAPAARHARVGDDAADAPAARWPPIVPVAAPRRRARSARSAGSPATTSRRAGRSAEAPGQPDVAPARPAGDAQGRPLDPPRTPTSRPGSSWTGQRVWASSRWRDRRACDASAGDASRSPSGRRASRAGGRAGMTSAGTGSRDNLDEIGGATARPPRADAHRGRRRLRR